MFKWLRKLKAARNFVRLVNDPNKLDDVFQLSDNTDDVEVLDRMIDGFECAPKGAQALARMRRLPKVDLAELAKLPDGTLGKAFAHHMISRGLDPASIPTLDAFDKREFVRAHLYETHDIWHVVTGFDTDVAGELGAQGFYIAQFHGPLPPAILAAGLLNTAFYTYEDTDARMRNITVGWRMGKRCEPLFGTDWDLLWDKPLAEVRALHGIDPAGALPELEREAQITTGFGGGEALERERISALSRRRSEVRMLPPPQTAQAMAGRTN